MADRAVMDVGEGSLTGPQRAPILALVLPVLLGALTLLVAAAGARRATALPSSGRPSPSVALGLAVRDDDFDGAFDAIRSGANPNAPVPYRDAQTANREITVAPLLIAVAKNRENMVMLLLGHGVTMDSPGNAGAICLARAMKEPAIVDILVRQGAARVPDRCPDIPAGTPPVLVFADGAPH